jgi:hypothetical protein
MLNGCAVAGCAAWPPLSSVVITSRTSAPGLSRLLGSRSWDRLMPLAMQLGQLPD